MKQKLLCQFVHIGFNCTAVGVTEADSHCPEV
jgi:hypothetical protein